MDERMKSIKAEEKKEDTNVERGGQKKQKDMGEGRKDTVQSEKQKRRVKVCRYMGIF